MLRHEPQAAGRVVRHPRRRAGPDVPAPRERNRPERVLPRQADGQVLAAQRPDAGLQTRWARSAAAPPGPPKATWPPRRSARSASRKARPRSARCSSSSPARRSASSSSPPSTAGRSTSARSGIREVETGMDTFYRFFKRFERVAGESFYTLSAAGDAKARAIPVGDRRHGDPIAAARDRGRAPQPLPGSDGRRLQHGRRHRLAVRSGPGAQQVRRRREARRARPSARPRSSTCSRRGAATLRELAATLGLFRKPPQEKAAGGDDLAGKLMKLLDRPAGRRPQEEGLCHGRPHPQHADRDRRRARRSARRDGVEPEVTESKRNGEGDESMT